MAAAVRVYHLYCPSVSRRVKTAVLRVLVPYDLVVGRTGGLDACNYARVCVTGISKCNRTLISFTGIGNSVCFHGPAIEPLVEVYR